jgi:hypothetical protein
MLTADTITDEQIREEIAWLETDLGILQAALRVTRGSLVPGLRRSAAEILNARVAGRESK